MITIALILFFTFIFILFLFFLIKKFVIKFFKEKTITVNIISVLISFFLYASLSISLIFYLTSTPKRKFDKSVWENNIGERYKMIDDLLDSKYFIGKKREQINKIFGTPKNSETEKIEYEIIGRTWSEFKIYKIELLLENDVVTSFNYEITQSK